MYDDTLKLKQTVRRVYLTAVCLIKQSTCFTRQLRFPIRASGSPIMDAAAATSEDGDDHLFISLSRSVDKTARGRANLERFSSHARAWRSFARCNFP